MERYILIKNDKPSQIEREVNKYLELGYVLVGGPQVAPSGYILQAMIREK